MYRSQIALCVAVMLLFSSCTTTASTPEPTLPPINSAASTPESTLSPVTSADSTSAPATDVTVRQEDTLAVLAQISQLVDVSVVQSGRAEVEVYSITYLSDGLEVKGYLAMPTAGENLPCVIFNRGGNRDFGALSDKGAANSLGEFASWGYVAVASQYRGNAGGEGQEEFGGADVIDVLNLIPLLESLPWADASRIGMFGWSRGGMMTYIALARTDRIAAAIVGAGIVDLFDAIERRPEMEEGVYVALIPNYLNNKENALKARSAIYWPEELSKTTPILLLHGSADWRVHPTQAIHMALALYESEHPFRFVFFEGGDHSLSEYQEEVDRLVKDWLDYYVRDQKPWPSLVPHGD
jgi:dipeptidyl aminopeptidase/acylaminoacyl peptidase